MYEVKKGSGPLKRIKSLTRKEEVVVNQLKAGYCKFSDGYLMDKDESDVTFVCGKFYYLILTVKHVVLEYPVVRNERAVLGDDPILEIVLIGMV